MASSRNGATRSGSSPLRDYERRIGRFCNDHGAQSLATVTPEDIRQHLFGLRVGTTSMHNHRRDLRAFFRWCVRKGWIEKDPTEDVDLPRPVELEVGILKPDEVQALLSNLHTDAVAYVALGTFAGHTHTEELRRLDWSAIDMKHGIVRIPGTVGKGGRKRQVPISANLRAWLDTCEITGGPITTVDPRRRLDVAKPHAGFRPTQFSRSPERKKEQERLRDWPRNAMRHSFGSYRLQETQNAAQVALEMGNSPQVVMKHYRELVLPDEAEAFWKITP